MDQSYTYQGSKRAFKSVANEAFNIIRSGCHYEENDLTSRVLSIISEDSYDRIVLESHRYQVVSLGSQERRLYEFKHFPGAYLITNYFTDKEQLIIANSMLRKHINPPNISNITKLDKNAVNLLESDSFIKKFKWATCGEQYDWSERKYIVSLVLDQEFISLYSEILSRIPKLSQYGYRPDAAIINLYNEKYHLNLHKEDAEESEAPVVTISLGRSAIFTLGKDDFNSLPLPIVLNSGDIFIMSDESRFSLHGVAKIIEKPIPCTDAKAFGSPNLICEVDKSQLYSDNDFFDNAIKNVLDKCRLSISIRKAKK